MKTELPIKELPIKALLITALPIKKTLITALPIKEPAGQMRNKLPETAIEQEGDVGMPLTMVKNGESNIIKKVGGKDETRKFLEKLGFVVGGAVTVISEVGGNVIVNIKDSRIAIGKEMANKIIV